MLVGNPEQLSVFFTSPEPELNFGGEAVGLEAQSVFNVRLKSEQFFLFMLFMHLFHAFFLLYFYHLDAKNRQLRLKQYIEWVFVMNVLYSSFNFFTLPAKKKYAHWTVINYCSKFC